MIKEPLRLFRRYSSFSNPKISKKKLLMDYLSLVQLRFFVLYKILPVKNFKGNSQYVLSFLLDFTMFLRRCKIRTQLDLPAAWQLSMMAKN
jgi:hypothetical protein